MGSLISVNPVFVSGPSAPYDLYATDANSRGTIPFTVTWPTAPQGTLTDLAVTDGSTLATALATPNARITVAAGSYGTLALAQDDQHWILDNGATFSGMSATGRPVRILIEGGNIHAGSGNITLIVDDLLFRNVNITVNTLALGSGTEQCNRYALIRSTVYAERYTHFTPGATAVPNKGSHHILAGNVLSGGMLEGSSGIEATVRTQGINNTVIVDNWVRCGFDGEDVKHTLRSHYGQDNWWARNNLIVYGDGMLIAATGGTGDEQVMGRHYVYDNIHYVPSNNPQSNTAHIFRTSTDMPTYWPDDSGAVSMQGNRAYDYRASGATSSRFFLNTQAWDSNSDNIEDEYEAPPAMSSWLVAGGVQPGADH